MSFYVNLNSAVEINAVIVVPLIDPTDSDPTTTIHLYAKSLIVSVLDQSSGALVACSPNPNTDVLNQPEFDCSKLVSKQI